MSKNLQYNCNSKILLVTISAAVLIGSFVVGSQFIRPIMAQDLGQMGEQMDQQTGEKVGSVVEQVLGGNQTGNQTGNQSG